MTRAEIIATLHEGRYSCVIDSPRGIIYGRERGVKDLFTILKTDPASLEGAFVADKVVGKGAAAIMIAGGVAAVYADVISEPALRLLASSPVEVSYGRAVPNIINRRGDGLCPVESLCLHVDDAGACLPLIENFIKQID